MKNNLHSLLQWLVALELDDIPTGVQKKAVLVLCDDIAAMAAGSRELEVQRLAGTLARRSGAPVTATVFGFDGMRVSPADAAVLNAIAGCWCELDEGYRPLPCHAGLYALPALLAESEIAGVSTGEVLRALVGAYEVGTRFAKAFRFSESRIHPHSFFSPIVAAAAVGLIRRAAVDQLESALTLASTLCGVGPFQHAATGVLARNTWAAVGTWCGLQVMDWAAAGISGSMTSMTEVARTIDGASFEASHLDVALGTHWGILDGYHKGYPCCQYTHSAIEAIQHLLTSDERLRGGVAIASIDVEAHPRAILLDEIHPATTLGARFSLPHAVAATLVYGDDVQEAFSVRSLTDPHIARLREAVCMRLFPDIPPAPLDRPCRVSIRLVDGSTSTATCMSARGGVDRPFVSDEILKRAGAIVGSSWPSFEQELRALYTLSGEELSRPWATRVASRHIRRERTGKVRRQARRAAEGS